MLKRKISVKIQVERCRCRMSLDHIIKRCCEILLVQLETTETYTAEILTLLAPGSVATCSTPGMILNCMHFLALLTELFLVGDNSRFFQNMSECILCEYISSSGL
mmetsp:Transcript_14180/g.21271  ORF Transcript_14180/g.21271 Transcript_14180/m.21271 type:complete len:105 (-) Transcript_14180:445-759(-)